MKFVNSKTIVHYADDLHKVQRKIAKLKSELKDLEQEESQLTDFILRQEKRNFVFSSRSGYEKVVRITQKHSLLVDLDEVRKMLKSRTPYKESKGPKRIKVDYVYEE